MTGATFAAAHQATRVGNALHVQAHFALATGDAKTRVGDALAVLTDAASRAYDVGACVGLTLAALATALAIGTVLVTAVDNALATEATAARASALGAAIGLLTQIDDARIGKAQVPRGATKHVAVVTVTKDALFVRVAGDVRTKVHALIGDAAFVGSTASTRARDAEHARAIRDAIKARRA